MLRGQSVDLIGEHKNRHRQKVRVAEGQRLVLPVRLLGLQESGGTRTRWERIMLRSVFRFFVFRLKESWTKKILPGFVGAVRRGVDG